ncbi:hypothetical protein JQK15_03810 [Sphingobium sp. BHU LFT2]|uniref:hypothetical protein n=1 Tax=Sphingobium sp. BHU LFT2 TaxID=2807634 RepID=UPI001BE7D276|nr:hypothetical protein [Sphingobium sp. BHU LFT2]MBT2242654.1 hypothetical protein [Sphingobium sp. BHU LFT2]
MSNFRPTGETVIFFREGMFYPLQLSGLKSTAEEAADHAACNPGTLRIEDLCGNVIWPEGDRQ